MKRSHILLALGLAGSLPVGIAGSALFLKLLERFPIVIWLGGALLGSIAGGLIPEDPAVQKYLASAATVVIDGSYTFFGGANPIKWEFEVEPIGMLFSLVGAVFPPAGGTFDATTCSMPYSVQAPQS